MCSRTSISKSTGNCSEAAERLRQAVRAADAVIVGAGAGLSTSAGFSYAGPRFQAHFADFIARYGFRDMYSAGFYQFDTPEEHWAFWSRFIWINRYQDPPRDTYARLRALIEAKEHFVITTNVDHCFQKAGFDKARLFYTQGDYGLWQCGKPCHAATYDNRDAVERMLRMQRDMRVPSELVPRCPRCGAPMAMNLRADERFVEDAGWHAAAQRYADFLKAHARGRTLYLEIGVGANTPSIIKYPFWRMTFQNPEATYACLNLGESFAPDAIRERSICIDGDVGDILERL